MTGVRRILLLSGPNLGALGKRQPEVYGTATLDEHVEAARAQAAELGYELDHVQSNHEGALIDAIHAAAVGGERPAEAIVINAGALTHTSWALHDALASFAGVSIELHISNPAAREPYRHTSVLAPAVDGSIAGFGGLGYPLAVVAVHRLLGNSGGGPAGGPSTTGAGSGEST